MSCRWIISGGAVALWMATAVSALEIDPLRTELSVEPGETLAGVIALTNEREEPVRLTVSFEDRSIAPNSAISWIEIDAGIREIAPGGSVAVSYRITVPPEAQGEFFGRLSFQDVQGEGNSAVAMQTRISVPIYAVIKGTEKYVAELTDVRLTKIDPPTVEITVTNAGNVHFRPVGECRITNPTTGKTVASFPINDQRFPVNPGQSAVLVGRGSQPLSPGEYVAEAVLPFPDTERSLTISRTIISVP